MKTILITNDPALARDAEIAGVNYIMVDLESIGKKERQKARLTFISTHQPEDVAVMRAALTKAELIVRINPWHAGSGTEIEQAIGAGAEHIMLPMIHEMTQIEAAIVAIQGRAKLIPLVETGYSIAHTVDIAQNPAIDFIYIGLNDLHLSLNLDFLFDPLGNGMLDRAIEPIAATGKQFGFGGIGAIGGEGELAPARILAEHARLGSSAVILSSRFAKDVALDQPPGRQARLGVALQAMQQTYETALQRNARQEEAEHAETSSMIQQLSEQARLARLG